MKKRILSWMLVVAMMASMVVGMPLASAATDTDLGPSNAKASLKLSADKTKVIVTTTSKQNIMLVGYTKKMDDACKIIATIDGSGKTNSDGGVVDATIENNPMVYGTDYMYEFMNQANVAELPLTSITHDGTWNFFCLLGTDGSSAIDGTVPLKIANGAVVEALAFSSTPPGFAVMTIGTPITPIKIADYVTGGVELYKYTLTNAPAGIEIDATTGVISGAPTERFGGSWQAILTVSDSDTPATSITQGLDGIPADKSGAAMTAAAITAPKAGVAFTLPGTNVTIKDKQTTPIVITDKYDLTYSGTNVSGGKLTPALGDNTVTVKAAPKTAFTDTYETPTDVTFTVTVSETPLSGTVAITGTAEVGKTLTATKSNVNDSGTKGTWYRDTDTTPGNGSPTDTAVGSINSLTYDVVAADIGARIYYELTPGTGFSGKITSAYAGPVAAGTQTVTKELEYTKTTLTYGDADPTVKTAPVFSPVGVITYTSSDSDIVSVSGSTGGVSIKKAGTATITATNVVAGYADETSAVTFTVEAAKPKITGPATNATQKFGSTVVYRVVIKDTDEEQFNTAGGTVEVSMTGNTGIIKGTPAVAWSNPFQLTVELESTAAVGAVATIKLKTTAVADKYLASEEYSFTITVIDKEKLTATPGETSGVYTGMPQAATFTSVKAGSTVLAQNAATNGYSITYKQNGTDVAAPTDVGDYQVILTPSTDLTANYVAPDNLTYTVTAKPVTLVGKYVKSYDGNTTAPFDKLTDKTHTRAVSLDAGDGTVTGATGAYTSAAVSANATVELTGVTLGGARAGNYIIYGDDGATALSATNKLTLTGNSITPVLLTVAPNMKASGTIGGSYTLANFITSAGGLVGADTVGTIFTEPVTLTGGKFGPTKGITIQFYTDDTYTTTSTEALPTAAGTYYYSVKVDAAAAVGTNYVIDATGVAPSNGILTIAAAPTGGGGGGVSSYMVTYDVGTNGKLAEGAKKTESVNYGKLPKTVPTVVANEGYKVLGWSVDGKTVVNPAEQKITKRTTFTALYEKLGEVPVLAFDRELRAPYIQGILNEATGETVFKPDTPMTRGEVAAMMTRTLMTKMDETKTYSVEKFPDLTGSEWYAQSVGYLAELGVMKGLENGTAGAEQYITRAEFVALVMRIDGVITGENKFPDVAADNWAIEFIAAASTKGYVDGDELGNFQPGANITRASVVKIMNAILGWDWATAGEMTFTDVPADHWAYNEIIKAATGK